MGGCGGHCRCADQAEVVDGPVTSKKIASCEPPKEGVMLDAEGKCPCGKTPDECCHKEVVFASEFNEALDELCADHGVVDMCDITALDSEEKEEKK